LIARYLRTRLGTECLPQQSIRTHVPGWANGVWHLACFGKEFLGAQSIDRLHEQVLF
jgi:hypothetical protein